MKNQYIGDVNDYLKYGLLRALLSASPMSLLVCWMLTPDDTRSDGNKVQYLKQPDRWAHYDPALFHALKQIVSSPNSRHVKSIETQSLLPDTDFFTLTVKDNARDRAEWFATLSQQAALYDIVFMDPDNGMEVKSRPYGRKDSSKYLFWREVEGLWQNGSSLLIYQHFPRQKRDLFIRQINDRLSKHTPDSNILGFVKSDTVFFLALQPKHHSIGTRIAESVENRWGDKIQCWQKPKVSDNFRSGQGKTTQIGFLNRNRQRILGTRGIPGTDHMQYAFKVECEHCHKTYGANGSDLFQRKCPHCQNGNPGISF